ncbi:uncharacterized protein LOC102155349 isoform X1 [Canis lupus familiaris]|uniref:uncharacterized protein LOC102155349 isoform X1 n=1 Tax=Canis lupus familiaris TaxID=9615 RepID=UPI0018F668CD|nr:uncharacterized protein LOC102155349 isoform X1 [Canis lupus familiaris]
MAPPKGGSELGAKLGAPGFRTQGAATGPCVRAGRAGRAGRAAGAAGAARTAGSRALRALRASPTSRQPRGAPRRKSGREPESLTSALCKPVTSGRRRRGPAGWGWGRGRGRWTGLPEPASERGSSPRSALDAFDPCHCGGDSRHRGSAREPCGPGYVEPVQDLQASITRTPKHVNRRFPGWCVCRAVFREAGDGWVHLDSRKGPDVNTYWVAAMCKIPCSARWSQ